MNQFSRGFKEVVVGIIGGIMFSTILSAFSKDETIPSNYIWIFTFVGLIGTVATLSSYWKSGFVFNLGWILGALILKDAMDTTDFLIYFIVPIIVMVIRIVVLIRKYQSN